MPRKVPSIPQGNGPASVDAMVKVVQYVTAQGAPTIQPLATTATTAQIIAKINEIINRLQCS